MPHPVGAIARPTPIVAAAVGIAFDASASNATNGLGGTSPLSTTVSHTIGGGSNRLVVVACEARSNAATTLAFTTVTYNGTNMTQAATIPDVGIRNRASIYYLLDSSLPAAGTYNVVVTASTTVGSLGLQVAAAVYSFTGAKQSAQPDATNTYTDVTGGSSISKSVVTVANNSWIVDCLGASAGSGFTGTAVAAGSQAHSVVLAPQGASLLAASILGPVSPAGSTATGWGTFGGANPTRWAYAQASFAPA